MSGMDYQALVRTAAQDSWSTLETLLAFVTVMLALLLVWGIVDALIDVVATHIRRPRHTRTTAEDRRERLLKLIASTDREDR